MRITAGEWRSRWRRAVRLTRNVRLDLRYGAFLGGTLPTRFAHRGARDTANSDYDVLARIFAGQIRDDDVLVDVGCGKGRVINWWLHLGARNRIIGIELDPAVAARTRRRLRAYPNVTILTGDAVDLLPPEGTLFYLFGPFQPPALRRFKDRLERAARSLHAVRIFYYSPPRLDLFEEDPGWIVERFDTEVPWEAQRHPWALLRRAPGAPGPVLEALPPRRIK